MFILPTFKLGHVWHLAEHVHFVLNSFFIAIAMSHDGCMLLMVFIGLPYLLLGLTGALLFLEICKPYMMCLKVFCPCVDVVAFRMWNITDTLCIRRHRI